MPNYFTHLQFGTRVLAALPESLRTRIEAQRAAFDAAVAALKACLDEEEA